MAVYKPTFCYPFLTGLDPRVGIYGRDSASKAAQFLTCKVDTSNKNVTGYKVRILNDANEVVFPIDGEGRISPIEEIQLPELGYVAGEASVNSGYNGTTMKIPFFQNYANRATTSFNAIYYKPKFLSDHLLTSVENYHSVNSEVVISKPERINRWISKTVEESTSVLRNNSYRKAWSDMEGFSMDVENSFHIPGRLIVSGVVDLNGDTSSALINSVNGTHTFEYVHIYAPQTPDETQPESSRVVQTIGFYTSPHSADILFAFIQYADEHVGVYWYNNSNQYHLNETVDNFIAAPSVILSFNSYSDTAQKEMAANPSVVFHIFSMFGLIYDNDAANKRIQDELIYFWDPDVVGHEIVVKQNQLLFDGMLLSKGDVLVAFPDSEHLYDWRMGIWEVDAEEVENDPVYGTYKRTVLKRVYNSDGQPWGLSTMSTGDSITILVGNSFANTTWIIRSFDAQSFGKYGYYSGDYDQYIWTDYRETTFNYVEGELQFAAPGAIPLFGVNNTRYKWEITLYQGNNVLKTVYKNNEPWVQYVEYSNIDSQFLDMTVSSGQIMGSTPERVQIGADLDFLASLSAGTTVQFDPLKAILPNGTTTDPLILQDRFIEFSSSYNGNLLTGGARVPVKIYDTTMGHIYPTTDSLAMSVLEDSSYCQFFKHSSDPTQILDSDIVNYACGNPVDIEYWAIQSGRWKNYSNDVDTWKSSALSALERHLVVGGSYSSLFEQMIGQRVLLYGQSNAYENGVYRIVSISGNPAEKITNLRNSVWTFYEDLNFPNNLAVDVNFNDTAPNYYTRIVIDQSNTRLQYVKSLSPDVRTTAYQNGWNGDAYRTITFTGGSGLTNTALIDWLYANATLSYGNIKVCLERDASYKTWSSYLGKIIYAYSGDNGGGNFESLATAGAYTLFDPAEATLGFSPLYFVKERPILLYQDQVPYTNYFDLYAENDFGQFDPNLPHEGIIIDGITIQKGNRILYKDSFYGIVKDIDEGNNQYFIETNDWGTVQGYCFINSGQIYGKLTIKSQNMQTSVNYDLYTAQILKNTVDYTYIGPWTNITKNMKLCLLENKHVKKITSVDDKWIKIIDFNDKTYCVMHEGLQEVLKSYPINVENNEKIPWRYDIRSFFRVSDENPFYCYQTPRVLIFKDGEAFSDLSAYADYLPYEVIHEEPGVSAYRENYLVDPNATPPREYSVRVYFGQSSVVGRATKLEAEYIFSGDTSWEFYQWKLFDAEGNLLQDTGRKYDKKIQVYFYGLANDSNVTNTYYAELIIENEYRDNIKYILRIDSVPGYASDWLLNNNYFKVIFDCTTHSNIVQLTKLIEDSDEFSYSVYRREYEVYKKPGKYIKGYYVPIFDQISGEVDGKFYYDAGHTEEIKGNSLYTYLNLETYYGTYGFTYQYNSETNKYEIVKTYKTYIGNWEPVLVGVNSAKLREFRDFNIRNRRSYQYIIYPADLNFKIRSDSPLIEDQLLDVSSRVQAEQTFANYDGIIWNINSINSSQGFLGNGNRVTAPFNGEPVIDKWNCWSITELIPEEPSVDAPIVQSQYKVDNNNIWLIRFSLETGNQNQNISREEFKTLGTYPKFGFGQMNADSGQISGLLGEEIIPYQPGGYVERLRKSRINALSTNENAQMAQQWHDFVYSHNPKLLKDIKGNSWIVQITGNNVTPQNFILKTPQTVSFEWKQVGSTRGAIIYGLYEDVQKEERATRREPEWDAVFQSQLFE